jgi:S1-C subfamily serine protease
VPLRKELLDMKAHYKTLAVVSLLALAVAFAAGSGHAGDRAWLGVVLQPLTVDLKEAMDLDRDFEGVLISDVVDDSPADEYGLEKGDIILQIDGKEIRTVSTATRIVKAHSPGDDVKIVVLRDGDRKKVIGVTLGEPEDVDYEVFDLDVLPDIGKSFKGVWIGEGEGYLGVKVQDVSSDLGDYFGVDAGEGVLVLDVMDDSPAEEAGIKDGDVILKVDGKKTTDTEKFVKYIKSSEPGEDVEVELKRKRRTQTIEVELGESPASHLSKHFIREFEMPKESYKKRIVIDTDDLDDDVKRIRIHRGELEEDLEELREELEELREELEELKGS